MRLLHARPDHGLLNENPNPTEEEVKFGLGGNLCRCTGYSKVIDAVMDAVESTKETE